MSVRISIMLDTDLEKKLRLKQAKKIQKTKDAISFSQVVNEAIREGLR